MFHLHDIKNRLRVPCAWFNRVAAFLNNLAPGFGISIRRPDNPTSGDPVEIAVDPEGLDKLGFARLAPHKDDTSLALADRAGNAPKTVLAPLANESNTDKAARVGTSMFAARADHEHRMPQMNFAAADHTHAATAITYGGTGAGATLHVSDALDAVVAKNADNDGYILKPPASPQGSPGSATSGSQTGQQGTGDSTSYDFTTTQSAYVEIFAVTRATVSGAFITLRFRPLIISPDGRIVSIGAESRNVASVASSSIIS